MKELKLEIKRCKDCPYCQQSINDGYYFYCRHPKRKIDDLSNFLYQCQEDMILLDCPLSNKKDPGAKVGTGIFIVKDNKILLGKRKNTEVGSGTWGLPGGRVDFGEKAEDTAIREVKEETGLDVKTVEFLTYSDDVYKDEHWVTLFYITNNFTGKVENKEVDKCEEWKWFFITELPENCFSALKTVVFNYKEVILSFFPEKNLLF